jgi:hypothetical protein
MRAHTSLSGVNGGLWMPNWIATSRMAKMIAIGMTMIAGAVTGASATVQLPLVVKGAVGIGDGMARGYARYLQGPGQTGSADASVAVHRHIWSEHGSALTGTQTVRVLCKSNNVAANQEIRIASWRIQKIPATL